MARSRSQAWLRPDGRAGAVYNFVAIDPAEPTAGMSRGGRGDREVWNELAGDPGRVHVIAARIEQSLMVLSPSQAGAEDEDVAEAPEGRILTRLHRVRERNRTLVEGKKRQALDAAGRLACEGCGFDFEAVYGPRGAGFVECHHTLPVSELAPGGRTRRADLALVCANCHRMIHRRAPWLTMQELRALVGRPA